MKPECSFVFRPVDKVDDALAFTAIPLGKKCGRAANWILLDLDAEKGEDGAAAHVESCTEHVGGLLRDGSGGFYIFDIDLAEQVLAVAR